MRYAEQERSSKNSSAVIEKALLVFCCRLPSGSSPWNRICQHSAAVSVTEAEDAPALGVNRRSGEMSVLNDLINGDLDGAIASLKHRVDVYTGTDTYIGDLELGHSEGVLASVINEISSGSLLLNILTTIDTIIAARSIKKMLLALLGFAAVLLFWIFVANIYRAVYARVFLEGRIYEKVPFSRFLFLFRMKKHIKASFTIAVYVLAQYLWMITIVLYPVKRYSYMLVPYLVAENPDLSPLEAIRLSQRMMKGHKWEAFCLELTLLPW